MSLIINALRHPVLIAYLSGANNYSFIHFRNGEQLMISKSLRYLEKQLPNFIRIHKTVLVNPDCVRELKTPPHSKTSGGVILENGITLPVSRRQWPVLLRELQPIGQQPTQPERSIALVSSDTTKALLLRQLISDPWPQTLLHVVENGAVLPNLLLSLPEPERPVLILLDLRQSTPGRLALLRELKESTQLRRLPVVLLLGSSASSNALGPGYALQANSAVVIPEDNTQFVKVMEQICRYWLSMAALPLV